MARRSDEAAGRAEVAAVRGELSSLREEVRSRVDDARSGLERLAVNSIALSIFLDVIVLSWSFGITATLSIIIATMQWLRSHIARGWSVSLQMR